MSDFNVEKIFTDVIVTLNISLTTVKNPSKKDVVNIKNSTVDITYIMSSKTTPFKPGNNISVKYSDFVAYRNKTVITINIEYKI